MNPSPPRHVAAHKPRKTVVPLAEALAWRGGGGFIYQEKMDGCFATLEVRGQRSEVSLLAGERMANGDFWAFDILTHSGQDVRRLPLRDRWRLLTQDFGHKTQDLSGIVPTGNGGEFLEAVLARGGEGIVAKDLDAPYGEMFAAKRIWEGLCVVTGLGLGTHSVAIADATTGQPRGRVTVPGFKIEKIRVGSILKVQGMNLTEAGKIREPRLCRDTPDSWLRQY